jgi:hypothetical protein
MDVALSVCRPLSPRAKQVSAIHLASPPTPLTFMALAAGAAIANLPIRESRPALQPAAG